MAPFSPCGRRWPEGPDEGFRAAGRHKTLEGTPTRGASARPDPSPPPLSRKGRGEPVDGIIMTARSGRELCSAHFRARARFHGSRIARQQSVADGATHPASHRGGCPRVENRRIRRRADARNKRSRRYRGQWGPGDATWSTAACGLARLSIAPFPHLSRRPAPGRATWFPERANDDAASSCDQ
jgi:hypothetical protein